MATFNDILTRINGAIAQFNKKVPGLEKVMLDGIEEELKRLDLLDGKVKPTVANIKIIASVKAKLMNIILNPDYVSEVKKYVQAFRDVSTLQNEYWRTVEKKFKPSSILKQVRIQAIDDTVSKLTEAGIGVNVSDQIAGILNTNITTGGSYKDLRNQLVTATTTTKEGEGVLSRYVKQITTDSIHQYNANYTQIVSSDLGYEWYAYQGSDIKTTRPFCDAMTDIRYFHISEIPSLLKAEGLYYTDKKTKEKKPVPIYQKTGLPNGMIPGTDPSNFFIHRGGYNCGHQIRPVSAALVPQVRKDEVEATPAYAAWARTNGK